MMTKTFGVAIPGYKLSKDGKAVEPDHAARRAKLPVNPAPDFLTHDELKGILSYDGETGEFRWVPPFGRRRRKDAAVAVGWIERDGYLRIYIKGRRMQASRLAWFYHFGAWPEGFVDHINGSRSDNRIENLREVSGSKNQWNKAPKKTGDGLKGVVRSTSGSTYSARICVNGRCTYLGNFKSRADAAAAYQAAAEKLHGEYAFHNRDQGASA